MNPLTLTDKDNRLINSIFGSIQTLFSTHNNWLAICFTVL